MSARIAIIGAGPGGLTAGIALLRQGFQVAIYEQAEILAEVGAGISLSQSAFSVCRALGLDSEIERVAAITAGMAFLHYRTGALLAGQLDLGQGSGDPAGPLAARQLHRADLQAILLEAFLRSGGTLNLGHRLVEIAREAAPVTARFANGVSITPDLLIGADGLKSRVRALLWGDSPVRFTGQAAYRLLVPFEAGRLQFGRSAVFQGPGRVFNRYTICGGSVINCVGIVRADQWLDDGWSIEADPDEVSNLYAGWHEEVTGLIRSGERMIKWGLFDRKPLERWSQGRVTLLGDAAHPMLPFLGLGAAMAIEDAMILARALHAADDIEDGLAHYEAARLPRTTGIHEQSRRQGEIVQAADPDRFQPAAAPSHNPAHYAYDPVTAPI